MSERPTGTVTFLFTDIEGSTQLWQDAPEAMKGALQTHDDLLREAIESHCGYVFKTVGDSFCAAFQTAGDALEASLEVQLALEREEWPDGAAIRSRTVLHTGSVESRDGDYFGVALSRVGRLLSAGHGGQILLSHSTRQLVQDALPEGTALRPMGTHLLKDLSRPEEVFQLEHRDLEGEFPALRTLDNRPNNLPRQLTSFVGREKELAELQGLFEKTSLLTLTGVGGTGKTRLALQFAADQLDRFNDGVWLADVGPLSDPGLVPNEVAQALTIKQEPGKSLTETLATRLKDKELLVVLDNCEHLLDSCAELTEELLRSCKGLKVLATSREPLGVDGEHTFRVPSFSSPPAEEATADGVKEYDAVRLFGDRAVAARDGFEVTDDNAQAVAAVCTRLDGIPLAIELAAARMRSMTPQDVNERLDQKFRLLTGGFKSSLKRQHTLQGLIDWSYDLLDGREKAALRRLSVFRGGWTAEGAEKVCSGGLVDESDVIDLLSSLVDKSLVIAEDRGGHARYRMLDTVRDYAADRLEQDGDPEAWRDRHLAYFAGLAEQAEPELTGKDQLTWLNRLEAEHDNLRAALDWASAKPDGAEQALRTSGLLWRFWDVHGHHSEGRARLESALERSAGETAARALALYGVGMLCWNLSEFGPAVRHLEDSLAIYRDLGDKRGAAAPLNGLGIVEWQQGNYASARRRYEETLALCRGLDNKRGVSIALHNLGLIAREQGDYAAARSLYEECLATDRELGDRRGAANATTNLGIIALEEGDYAGARRLHEESLALYSELGDRRGVAAATTNLGTVDLEEGDCAAARRLVQESSAIFLEIGDPLGAANAIEVLAPALSIERRPLDAARLWGAAEALREEVFVARAVERLQKVRFAARQAARKVGTRRLGRHVPERVVGPLGRVDHGVTDSGIAHANRASWDG
ncbi:MAG: tetratricopeptide repeat protein [Armatimonadetes bacterium]|nr:tetratricopeptide repeat protein [Armatimonadota bacterium]